MLGLGLGIGGITDKDYKKTFGIIGLILNVLSLAMLLITMIFSIFYG